MLRTRPFFLQSAFLLLLAAVRLSLSQDLASPDILSGMRTEWNLHPAFCLRALELFGQTKANTDKALAELEHDQNQHIRDLYDFAGHRDSAAFFHLLAAAYDPEYPPDCSAADLNLKDEFYANASVIRRASAAYSDKGDIAALHILLAGLDGSQILEREHLMGCYAVSSKHLFYKVNEILGAH